MNSKIVNCYRLFTQQIVAVFEMYLYSNQPLIIRKVINDGVYSLWQDAYIIHSIYKYVYKDKIDFNYMLKHLNEKLKRSTIAIYSRLLKLLTKIDIFQILICIKTKSNIFNVVSKNPHLNFILGKIISNRIATNLGKVQVWLIVFKRIFPKINKINLMKLGHKGLYFYRKKHIKKGKQVGSNQKIEIQLQWILRRYIQYFSGKDLGILYQDVINLDYKRVKNG